MSDESLQDSAQESPSPDGHDDAPRRPGSCYDLIHQGAVALPAEKVLK